jgi:hypothetical protein
MIAANVPQKQKEYCLLRYFRNKKNQKVGIFVAFKFNDCIFIGTSFCDIRYDKFNKDTGLDIAYHRAYKNFEKEDYEKVFQKIPHNYMATFSDYLDDTKKYFFDKDKGEYYGTFPLWFEKLDNDNREIFIANIKNISLEQSLFKM